MRKLQSQGVHHVTLTGADRQTSIDTRTPTDPGCVHHLAFSLSQATFQQVVERLGERGDYNIAQDHLADAIETLVRRSRASLSDDRSPRDPYH